MTKIPVTWKNTLSSKTVGTKPGDFIIVMLDAANACNYPYFEWNTEIYRVVKDEDGKVVGGNLIKLSEKDLEPLIYDWIGDERDVHSNH